MNMETQIRLAVFGYAVFAAVVTTIAAFLV